jgi:anaerobic selenocysteine-containing dehydrogenase
MKTAHTFCRICEPNCPLLAEIDDAGKITKLIPDVGHPSGSTACHKGLSFIDVHNDPDRANWPQRRLNPRSEARGEFVQTAWNSALSDIGKKLNAIREKHGANAIAVYHGNPIAFDSTAAMSYEPFLDAIGTGMRFSGGTQDMQNKTTGAAYLYGSTNSFVLPDLENTDYLLCIGSNPKVSRWTLASVPNDSLEVVKRIRQRGGKVRFVNPRLTESSTSETGPTLLIKPATDVYFMAAVLNEIEVLGGFDVELLERYGKHVEGLTRFIHRYPAEKVAGVTGIEAAEIKQVAAEIAAAKSAIVYSATGINQSRQGMLGYWLTEMLNFATGNFGRKGGTYKPLGLFGSCRPVSGKHMVDTTLGKIALLEPIGYGSLPAAILPDLIENGDIRALILWGSNPLLTVGGEERMRKAFEKLEMLVSIDIYRSASGELSDYVLPVTDWLERKDINLVGCSGFQMTPFVQYTDATETPVADRRDAAWILARLEQEMGLPSVLDDPEVTDVADHLLNQLLGYKDLSTAKLVAEPWQTIMLPEEDPAGLFEHCLVHADKRVDCCPTAFEETGLFDRCDAIFEELQSEPKDALKLISLRTPYMQNTWMTNMTIFRRGKESVNPLHMCEKDAMARGLYEGDPIRVFNEHGSLETQVRIDNDLRSGAVAMSHGYGQARTYSQKVASEKAGVNCNVLMPVGAGTYEPISYMSWLCGVPVNVEKARAQ